LLHLFERDPDGVVVLLPADHYVRDERVLAISLREAARLAQENREDVFLLGVEPDSPDPELGYILPSSPLDGGAMSVSRFVEKPSIEIARSLLEQGALWNVFIVTASIRALLAMYQPRFAESLSAMRAAIAVDRADAPHAQAVAELYKRLGVVDFSGDVLQHSSKRLRVVPVRDCGWTDLGTPQRVAATLRRGRFGTPMDSTSSASGSLNLAAQHSRINRVSSERAYQGAMS